MKTAKKADAASNRQRQKTFRDEARKQGMRKVSFYLTSEEKKLFDLHCNGRPQGYSIIEAIHDSQALRKHLNMMSKLS